MEGQFTNSPLDASSQGQAQARRDQENVHNQQQQQPQNAGFLQETGTQVKNVAQGAADVGISAAQGVMSLARGAAQGAANVAQGTADLAQGAATAVKSTLGMNNASSGNNTPGADIALIEKNMADESTNPAVAENHPSNPAPRV